MSGLKKPPKAPRPTAVGGGADLAKAKELLLAVLTGAQTEASHPALVNDDLLLFAVAAVEAGDPLWIERHLKDGRYTTEARTLVGLQLRGPLRRPLLEPLGVPAFLLGL